MSTNYPRALYKGDQKNNECVIADGEDHEAQLREQGFMHYLDLPEAETDEPETESTVKADGSSDERKKVQEELLEALETNQELEEQLATAKGEYIVRINELKKENDNLKYSAMSAAELKTVLDGKGIKYGSRDEKEALVKLVLESLYPVEGE
ncbi:hypothetical protein [Acinetobacter calcoaceticus]|uniref:hypothetical protein n=1 Tax=Acinetobacter calcoaceticus TaxID=471 RepID=UPI0018DEAFA4|nr:hypothetical protein [Acinetobacter calcoaceticus]